VRLSLFLCRGPAKEKFLLGVLACPVKCRLVRPCEAGFHRGRLGGFIESLEIKFSLRPERTTWTFLEQRVIGFGFGEKNPATDGKGFELDRWNQAKER
jgi:hypothetical protein